MTKHWSAAMVSLGLAVVPSPGPREHWAAALVPIRLHEVGTRVE